MHRAANMSAFLAGLELAREFYRGAVKPILDRPFPQLPHSAALIGSGSEVLGYDDPMSTDHHWGPRVMLFLGGTRAQALREKDQRDSTSGAAIPLHGLFHPFQRPEGGRRR